MKNFLIKLLIIIALINGMGLKVSYSQAVTQKQAERIEAKKKKKQKIGAK